MSSLFASTLNTRILPTGSLRYLRSDAPLHLSAPEIQWLRDHQVLTLVDLRSEDEVARNPCPLQAQDGFTYIHLPVTGGGDTPRSLEHLHAVYLQMVNAQMERILDTILTAKSNVMYFCTAGKDRTGVVSALLLRRLGFSDEVILRDYMASKDNLMNMLTAHVQAHPEVDIEIIIPHEENIKRLLRQIPGSPS